MAICKTPKFSTFNFQFSTAPAVLRQRAANDRPYGERILRLRCAPLRMTCGEIGSVAHGVRRYRALRVSYCLLPAAYCLFLFCSSHTSSTATSAGLTPEILDAWPTETGRILFSFSRASTFSAGIAS